MAYNQDLGLDGFEIWKIQSNETEQYRLIFELRLAILFFRFGF